ncbi:MAG: GntR family transcriptional regulator [Pseudonocardiales bacterium]|nr:GntR family transcriptional regulator [Pseudonocardiales bacterium]
MFPYVSDRESMPAERSSEIIYGTIRHLIISGSMPPWTRLVEEEVAREFKTSRSPVREALRRLEYDGLVRTLRRGHLVSIPITEAEREDLHLIRLEIDRLTARLGCDRVQPEEWSAAREAVLQMGHVVATEGLESRAFVLAHIEVHATIQRLSFKGHIAGRFARQLLSYTTVTDNAHPELPALSPVDQHLNLIDELASRNKKRAVAAIELHARSGYAPNT